MFILECQCQWTCQCWYRCRDADAEISRRPKSEQHQELFQHASDIKIKKIKVINMASIKRNNQYIHWNIFPFSQETLQTKSKKVQSAQVLFPKVQNVGNNIDFGRQGFFQWKRDFLFLLNSFVQNCRLLTFFEKNAPNCWMVIEMLIGALYALISINSKL